MVSKLEDHATNFAAVPMTHPFSKSKIKTQHPLSRSLGSNKTSFHEIKSIGVGKFHFADKQH